MDPELNPDDPDQLRSELTAEEQAAADQAANSAFRDAFGEDAGGAASTTTVEDPASKTAAAPAAPAARTTDAATVTEPKGGKEATTTEVDDPFKDLNPKVRDMLAEIPQLQRDLASMKGRVAPTQKKVTELERENERLRRELEQRGTSSAPAKTAAPSELEARVRGELPEVADLINERVEAALKGVKPAEEPTTDDPGTQTTETTTIHADPAIVSLKKVHPDWDKTMVSTDYRLWVSAKGADYQRQIMSSDDPVEVSASLSEFKAHRQRTEQSLRQTQTDTTQRRQTRTERGVEPGGRRAPAGDDAQMTEHDAMVAAFNSP